MALKLQCGALCLNVFVDRTKRTYVQPKSLDADMGVVKSKPLGQSSAFYNSLEKLIFSLYRQ